MSERHVSFQHGGFETDRAEMNMTPMIDVVFLLIIFFMAAYQLSEAQTSGEVELPVASRAYPPERRPPNTIIIEIVSAGGLTQPYYMVGGRTFVPADWTGRRAPQGRVGTWEDLRKLLKYTVGRAKAQGEPMPPVVLHADRRVEYRYVVHLMALCARLGIRQFAFEARQPTERPKTGGS